MKKTKTIFLEMYINNKPIYFQWVHAWDPTSALDPSQCIENTCVDVVY